jgi:hypothetical protein
MKPTKSKNCHNHYAHNLVNRIHSKFGDMPAFQKNLLCLVKYVNETEAQMVNQKGKKLNSFVVFLQFGRAGLFPVKYN